MRIKVLGSILWITGILLAGQPVFAEANGTISGNVVNGSPGAEIDGSLNVTLEAYDRNNRQLATIGGESDEDGRYLFTAIDTDATITYYVAAEYKGIVYYSEALLFSGEATSIEYDVNVYEQTDSDAAISVALSHTIITGEAEGLSITEFFIIENSGDYSYIGSGEVIGTAPLTMLFPIPDIAQAIEVGGEIAGQVTFTSQGLVYSGAIRPGYMTATYTYHLHDLGSKYTLDRLVSYPMTRYELLVQGVDKLSAEPLVRQEPLIIENVSYQYFTASGISAWQTVLIEIPFGAGSTQIALVIGGALIVAVAAFVLISRRNTDTQVRAHVGGDSYATVLRRIARLDDEYEAGEINETDYRSARAVLKEKAMRLKNGGRQEGE